MLTKWTDGQKDRRADIHTNTHVCVSTLVGLCVRSQAIYPRTLDGHPLSSREGVAGTRAASLVFWAVCVGPSCSGIRHCNCGFCAFHWGSEESQPVRLRLLRLGSGLPGTSQAYQGYRSWPGKRKQRGPQVGTSGPRRGWEELCPWTALIEAWRRREVIGKGQTRQESIWEEENRRPLEGPQWLEER